MDIFSIITLLGGLAFFLYGMHVMSHGLEKMTGGSLERSLNKMTASPYRGLLLGMGITIAIQSSSALTVMLVGLVNSGVMQFSQTVSVIMGSNIGTTLTAWILSLAGIDSGNILLKLLKPSSFAPVLALVGILLMMAAKSTKKRDVGNILIGFSILMSGMTLMSDAMSPLSDMPGFTEILVAFNNPILGVLVGCVFTGIIQSSAASVGILQALSLTGNISYGMAIPIIMGQNIGTCVTSVISCIGVNRNAKRVAALHVIFNVIGTVICLALFYTVGIFVDYAFTDLPITPVQIALVHSIFNVFTTAILLPFRKLLIKLSCKLVPEGKDAVKAEILIDQRLLNTPSFAISECNRVCCGMAAISCDAVGVALRLTDGYTEQAYTSVYDNESVLDRYEDTLGSYLVKLSSKNLSDNDSRQVAKLLHCIGDYERIGDHAINIADAAKEIFEKKITFSSEANHELSVLKSALSEILDLTAIAFSSNDAAAAAKVEPLEQLIDELILQVKTNHINRLQAGNCTIELGFVLSDLLTNIERISDHCSNIAVAIIEVSINNFDAHEYMSTVKSMDNEDFRDNFKQYKQRYYL